MNCRINLIKQKDYSIIKSQIISKNTYIECEEEVKKLNSKLDTNKKYWTISAINV